MKFIKAKTILSKVKYGDMCYGILYNTKDIIKAYKKEIKKNEQMKLF